MQIIKNALKAVGLIDRLELETFKLESQEITKEFEKSYLEKVDKLKAEGLKAHIEKSKGIIPFPKLSISELRVWNLYCPTKKELDKVDTIIPSQILDLIVEVKTMFDSVEIWSEAKETIDPIVVGIKKTGQYSWEKDTYLLARWGESLRAFHEISKIVKEKLFEERKLKLEKMARQIKEALEDNANDILQYFEGNSSDQKMQPNLFL